MTYLLLVLIASTGAAIVGRRFGGARWCVAGGTAVGLVAGIGHAARPTLFLAENGMAAAFLAFGLPSMLVDSAPGSRRGC